MTYQRPTADVPENVPVTGQRGPILTHGDGLRCNRAQGAARTPKRMESEHMNESVSEMATAEAARLAVAGQSLQYVTTGTTAATV
jgi:hypothetical protein